MKNASYIPPNVASLILGKLTDEEERLLKALSVAPKCMHPLDEIIELTDSWKCRKCGLDAKKITKIFEVIE